MSELADVYQGELANEVFIAPSYSDLIDLVIGQYRMLRNDIEEIGTLNHAAVYHFLNGNRGGHEQFIRNVSDIFKTEGAIASLNAEFWQKALSLTDVYEYMPNNRRNVWNDQIREMTTPDFEEAVVRLTITELLNSRQRFFSERVDGIFRALSGEHVTNRPEGFGKRMILARVFNEYGHNNHDIAGESTKNGHRAAAAHNDNFSSQRVWLDRKAEGALRLYPTANERGSKTVLFTFNHWFALERRYKTCWHSPP